MQGIENDGYHGCFKEAPLVPYGAVSIPLKSFRSMANDKIPSIEARWVCIATDKQAVLAAILSSYFREPGVYFGVFEFPSVSTPYSPTMDYDADGAFGQIQGKRAAMWLNNALSAIQPEEILLLGLTEAEKSYLLPFLSGERLVHVADPADFPKREPFTSTGEPPLKCPSAAVSEGLLQSKVSGKNLLVDQDAPSPPRQLLRNGKGIVVIESGGGIGDIIAINYAFAVGADVVLVPSIEKSAIDSLPRQLDAWSRDRSSDAFVATRREITRRIKNLDFSSYEFATFFTVGLPYGLVLRDVVPCTHVMKGPSCGEFISNTLVLAQSPISSNTALVFSPQLFASEETADIANTLHRSNYNVKLLLGENATVRGLDYYGSYFPYDILHICSHGGETSGYYSILDFQDRQDQSHRLEFYEVVGFSPAGNEMVKVESKAIFTVLDGFPWRSEPLKRYPAYVYEDLFKALKADRDEVARHAVRGAIALSCHIQCSDSIHQGAFQTVAGFGHPVVFNNTCSSTHEMAGMFLAAGTRCYIGTLWAIDNAVATKAAQVFYAELVEGGRVLDAFTAMNKAIKDKRFRDVYILWGLQVSSVHRPTRRSPRNLLGALLKSWSMWMRNIKTTPDPKDRERSIEIAEFIRAEIMKSFSPEHLKDLRGFDPTELDRVVLNLPEKPDDTSARAPSELILATEVRRPTPEEGARRT